jgi:SAM-dependent methyltransferase
VFAVESVCHANDMGKVLSKIYRLLNPGGYFILFDGFRKHGFDKFDAEIKKAVRLTEVAMAIAHPWIVDDWLELARQKGFNVFSVEDLSEAIMPNLMRFQLLAKGYYKYPLISHAFLKVLSPTMLENSIAGLLLPFTVKAGAQGYFNLVLGRM